MKKMNYKKLQIFVFTISFVIILVCSLYLTNIISYAEGNFDGTVVTGSFKDYYNMPDTFPSREEYLQNFPFALTAQNISQLNTNYQSSSFLPANDFRDYGCYILLVGNSNTLYMASFPSNSIIIFNDSSYRIYVDKDFLNNFGLQYSYYFNYSATDFTYSNSRTNASFYWSAGHGSGYDIDGNKYYYEGRSTNILSSNIPMYYSSNLQPSTVEGLTDVNPYSGNNYVDGEKSENNLYFESADWSFKHNQYFAPYSKTIDTGSVYPYGTINFSFLPNEYQKSNPTKFIVNLTFDFDYSVTHTSGSGALASKTKDYYYFKYDNNGSTSIDVPLSTFMSNGDSYSITFEEVFQNLKDSNRTLGGILLQNKEFDLTEYNKFNLYCYAKLVSGEDSSGNYTEWYNPINKKGYTTDRNGETNKNPYSQEGVEDNSTSMEVPGDAGTNGDNSQTVGGGSSASASTGAITINNNINNNNTSNDLKSGGLISTIISLLGDNVSNGSDSVESLAGVNGYVELANTTLSSVPNSLWMVIVTTFSAVVVITIIAFIISILFKIFF